ncbi:MAG: SRPBCC family protein [Gemmatimonadota bacterium]
MKWLLYGLGSILGLFGLVVLTGLLLPAGHTAAVAGTYRASPEAVWHAVTDLDGLAAWRPDVDRVERLGETDGLLRWREHNQYGAVTYQALEAVPGRRFAARIVDEDLPYGGTWTWLFEPAEGGTRLTIVEEGQVYNPIFRTLSRFVFGHHRTLEAYHELLATHLGQEVSTAHVEVPAT